MSDTILLWDSSGLGKRYVKESGSIIVDTLFDLELTIVTAYLCYVEVANIIHRHRNRGQVTNNGFVTARQEMARQLLNAPDVTLLSASDADLLASIPLTDLHNLNANDGVILYIFRNYVQQSSSRCILVVADKRFERAATAEGIECLNPEVVSVADLGALRLTSAPT